MGWWLAGEAGLIGEESEREKGKDHWGGAAAAAKMGATTAAPKMEKKLGLEFF